jgi:hypothetical protein
LQIINPLKTSSNKQIDLGYQKKFFDPKNSQSEKITQLKEKYKLTNVSSPAQLEKGLRRAAASNQVDDITSFLQLGVDINAADEKQGKTALHHAVLRKLTTCIRTLLANGASYYIYDVESKSALDYAFESESEEILNLFLEFLTITREGLCHL